MHVQCMNNSRQWERQGLQHLLSAEPTRSRWPTLILASFHTRKKTRWNDPLVIYRFRILNLAHRQEIIAFVTNKIHAVYHIQRNLIVNGEEGALTN